MRKREKNDRGGVEECVCEREGVGGEKGCKNEGCEANDARLSPPWPLIGCAGRPSESPGLGMCVQSRL